MEKVLPQEAGRASGGFFCKLFVQLPGQRSAAALAVQIDGAAAAFCKIFCKIVLQNVEEYDIVGL